MVTSATGATDRVLDLFLLAVGVGCGWLGWRPALWPRRVTGPARRPRWVARAWGLGYLVLGAALVAESVIRLAGGWQRWPMDVVRWVAGPLVVGSLLADLVVRRRERGRGGSGVG
ncbi:hypothetical protein [Streptomyces sp. NPDC057702]|uniref:hypothetical protein n=1 Tax=unclassified Streptomyces TaxID=2593676 RepID=UPI003687D918